MTQLVPALKGLAALGKDIPSVRVNSASQRSVSVAASASNKNVKYDIVDSLGKPLTGAKVSKVSLTSLSDTKAGVKDVTNQVKVDNGVATWSLGDLPIGRY